MYPDNTIMMIINEIITAMFLFLKLVSRYKGNIEKKKQQNRSY